MKLSHKRVEEIKAVPTVRSENINSPTKEKGVSVGLRSPTGASGAQGVYRGRPEPFQRRKKAWTRWPVGHYF